MMERNPSHFGSYESWPSGTLGTDLASIGDTGGITGSCMGSFWPTRPTRTGPSGTPPGHRPARRLAGSSRMVQQNGRDQDEERARRGGSVTASDQRTSYVS